LAKDPAMRGGVAFRVSCGVAEKVERFNLTARRSQSEEIDRRARKQGMLRSAFILGAALGTERRNHKGKGRSSDKRQKILDRHTCVLNDGSKQWLL
jgi:ferric-dicitrate binding protein FerR (iron transport regulator)